MALRTAQSGTTTENWALYRGATVAMFLSGPTAVATASAIFLSATALSSALGGVAGGVGAAVAGLPLVFLIPATLAFLAVIGLALMARSVPVSSPPATRRSA